MGMPNNLILIRHGESEGNIAVERSKKGDHSAFNGPFKDRHSSQWRLTRKGVEQAVATGEWLRNELKMRFDRLYTSEYIRAMETAAHLGIEGAKWFTEFYLRERNWGDLDRVSVKEREERYRESLQARKIDSLYWTPPNGESMADTCLRNERIINTMHRECDGKNVAIVCHGEVMWGFRIRLERMLQETFLQLDASKNPEHRIHNCTVIHYTRINPFEPGHSPSKSLDWMRILCPSQPKLGLSGEWRKIHRPSHSNADLLDRVNRVSPLLFD